MPTKTQPDQNDHRKAAREKRDEIIDKYDEPLAVTAKDYSVLELLHVDALEDPEPLDAFIKRRCDAKKQPYTSINHPGWY